MPAYNSEQTIGNAIESILNQSYDNLHLNVVDDCSTDDTLKIAKSFAKKDKRVSVYSNSQNMGAYYSRNLGIYVSKGDSWDYFTTHDADDVSFENRYEVLIKHLSGNIIGMGDTHIRARLIDNKKIKENTTMAHAVFKRQVFENIGYFEERRFGADWEYWARLKKYCNFEGFSVDHYRVPLGISYIHENNLTVQIPERSSERAEYVKQTNNKLSKIKNKSGLIESFSPKDKGYKRIVK